MVGRVPLLLLSGIFIAIYACAQSDGLVWFYPSAYSPVGNATLLDGSPACRCNPTIDDAEGQQLAYLGGAYFSNGQWTCYVVYNDNPTLTPLNGCNLPGYQLLSSEHKIALVPTTPMNPLPANSIPVPFGNSSSSQVAYIGVCNSAICSAYYDPNKSSWLCYIWADQPYSPFYTCSLGSYSIATLVNA